MAHEIPDLGLSNLDENTQEPPQIRIKNAAEGRKAFHTMMRDDEGRSIMRTRRQALLDGEPPFSHERLVATGQSQRTNVNWGDARSVMDGIESGLIDIDVSVERLMRTPLFPQAVPDEESRFNFENMLAEEATRLIRDWEGYDEARLNVGRVCFWDGVGIAYFEDDIDWRFETTGLGDFVIPNGTRASENRIVLAGCRRYMELHELYGHIADEDMATNMGWDVAAVKKAIINAVPEHRGQSWSVNAWAKVQEEIRTNSVASSVQGRTAKVGVLHLWCQEFDGTVSKYLTTESPPVDSKEDDNEPWLYKRPHIYEEMRRGLVFFTYSIGEYGTYHSISGLGRRVFPQGNALNRAMCTMLDAAIVGSGILMQPENEPSISKMKLVPVGGAMTILPAADQGQMILRPMPDLSHGIQPIIADMRDTMGRRAGQFQGDSSPFNTPVEKTRFEVAAQLEALGKVGATQMNLWYPKWSRLLREVLRRICRADYREEQPGGKEVAVFRKRLLLRGFPLELLQAVDFDSVKAERAIGAGSGASRIGRLTQLKEQAGEMGETGRYRLNRDICAATLDGDYDAASRYFPPQPEPLPPIDAQFATLENKLVKSGEEPQIIDGQMDMVHLAIHTPYLIEMAESTKGSEEAMVELAEPMLILHSHGIDHLERVQGAQTIEQQVAEYRQVYQQLGEIVGNAVRKAISQQQKAAEEGGQEGNSERDELMMQKAAEAAVKLQSMRTQGNLKMAIDIEREQLKEAHKERAFRAEMGRQDARTAAQMIADARRAEAQRKQQELLQKAKADAAAKAKPKKPAA
jgi:hypothetical protein